jgi:hypothetical protein
MAPTHSKPVLDKLRELEAERDQLLKLAMDVIGPAGGAMTTTDFFVFGAVKRYLSLSEAFRLMIEHWNLVCARALLRMHIDTALRFSALWLVDDPSHFASAVLGGTQINHLKSRTGEKLRDEFLVRAHTPGLPWLPKVYRSLSGYVHFSGAQIFDAAVKLNDESRTVHFQLSAVDHKFPAFSWIEVMDCFMATSTLFTARLTEYRISKHVSHR